MQIEKHREKVRAIDLNGQEVAIGQWFWVKDEEDGEWLGCIMGIGSNYVLLNSPHSQYQGYHYDRVHFAEFFEKLRFEPNPQSVIGQNIEHFRSLTDKLLAEVRSITGRLGVSPHISLPGSVENDSRSLAVLSGQNNIKDYKDALVLAKEKQLPELFKAIKNSTEEMSRWMTAATLPLNASISEMEESISVINGRIFNVSIYAGLVEHIEKCCDGEPAAFYERLHVMQRLNFCDEECLLNFKSEGMDFQQIREFDAWISEPENRDRILPFPRTLVAMRVRREQKERSWDGTLLSAFINFRLDQQDKLTFLYIRNGSQIYRLNCELEFDEFIFPEESTFRPGEEMMVKMFGESVDKMITRADFDERVKKEQLRKYQEKQWKKEHPKKTWDVKQNGSWDRANPYSNFSSYFDFRESDWNPFDESNVYFDEISKGIAEKIKKYNRIALLIQGIFDRSPILHPHGPIKSWDPEGFKAAITLVRDGENTLYQGEKPDFEAYRAKCNESLSEDSVVTGQERYWMLKEAEKENKRVDRDWRIKQKFHHDFFKPYGNPGPGYISKMHRLRKRAGKAIFQWDRERQSCRSWNQHYGDPIPVTLAVPIDQLFNVSAYHPGDYKQFFQDPRTRAEYLKWAPMLLAAEEYHAGKFEMFHERRREEPSTEQVEL